MEKIYSQIATTTSTTVLVNDVDAGTLDSNKQTCTTSLTINYYTIAKIK
jgi:hypothetical protein